MRKTDRYSKSTRARWLACAMLLALMVAACVPATAPPVATQNTSAIVDAIARVLDDWHRAAATADEERYFLHLDEDSIFLGTDATERWDKKAFRAYAHPHFEKGKAWAFTAVRRAVVTAGADVAWFDEDLHTQGLGPARGSGVMVRRGGAWKILQYNLALTIPNDRFAMVKEAAGSAIVLSSASDPLSELAWLTGSWVGPAPDGKGQIEEHWTHAAGSTLVGSGRTTSGGTTAFFEHLRIERRDDGIVYVAQPLGRPPTEFKREPGGAEDKHATFVNPSHDFPKRLTYRREGDQLFVRIEGDKTQRSESWVLKKAVIERR